MGKKTGKGWSFLFFRKKKISNFYRHFLDLSQGFFFSFFSVLGSASFLVSRIFCLKICGKESSVRIFFWKPAGTGHLNAVDEFFFFFLSDVFSWSSQFSVLVVTIFILFYLFIQKFSILSFPRIYREITCWVVRIDFLLISVQFWIKKKKKEIG